MPQVIIKTESKTGIISGALLVAGTSIGAGMLGLPVMTGLCGFGPALLVLLASYVFMTLTGFLFAELSIWQKGQANILSLAEKTLGGWGKTITWSIYLFFFYALLTAYLVGGGNLLRDTIGGGSTTAITLFGLFFIGLMCLRKQRIDSVNTLCMAGLFTAYIGFVLIGLPVVKPLNLAATQNWSLFGAALPIAFTSFGFQGLIPTLSSWMGYERRSIFTAIGLGTTITLVIYAIWLALILGIVPVMGEHGLQATLAAGRDAIYPLHFFTQNPIVLVLGRLFAFFAIATSFLGVGVGMLDFWADGLQITVNTALKKTGLFALAFLVPFFIAITYPTIFLVALSTAGGIGSALLLGVLPIVMSIVAIKKGAQFSTMNSQKWIYAALLLFIAFEMICEFSMMG